MIEFKKPSDFPKGTFYNQLAEIILIMRLC